MTIFARAREDIRTVRRRDPAARSNAEVAFTYSGVHAVWWYRMSHALWLRERRFSARAVSQFARMVTGVEIHPAAVIGRRLFIDHGMGVVIGETAVIGDDVMLYHGVTLGGRSSLRERRHPTIGDRVTIGTGAVVLGAISVGADSVIGAQAVVVRNAPPRSILTGIPATAVAMRDAEMPDDAADGFFVDPAIYI